MAHAKPICQLIKCLIHLQATHEVAIKLFQKSEVNKLARLQSFSQRNLKEKRELRKSKQ